MEEKKNLNEQRYLEFQLGQESYAVELLLVKEVITPPECTSIPKAPAYVCGLMNLRGLVLTVVDLRKKLAVKPIEDQRESAVIIFDLEERLVGAWVDQIHRVISIRPEQIQAVPPTDNAFVAQHLEGIMQNNQKLIMWMNIKKLLESAPQAPAKVA
jgi:purine-binding chemotaxis protein CheW